VGGAELLVARGELPGLDAELLHDVLATTLGGLELRRELGLTRARLRRGLGDRPVDHGVADRSAEEGGRRGAEEYAAEEDRDREQGRHGRLDVRD
jgi:hypothetical protein